jgi:sec-independent protein translocase protein TatB
MEILGVGPLEFILFLVLALVILGPQDMVGTARKIGQWVYRVVRSPTWRAILETSQDLRDLPQKIVRDAGLEETMKEIKGTADEVKADINQTTRELTAEMQAATTEVTREMQVAVQDANAGMKKGCRSPGRDASAGAGLSG